MQGTVSLEGNPRYQLLGIMMKRFVSRVRPSLLGALIFLALPLSCSSVALDPAHMQECQCGTAEFDTLGCASECALAGPDDCDNPLCTCEHQQG